MRRFLLTILLIASFVGFIKAQETTGDVAAAVKKEIIELERQKEQALKSNGSIAADFLDLHDVDNIDYTGPDGDHITKADLVAEWRTGVRKVLQTNHSNQYDYQVHLYGNGSVAVVTYLSDQTLRRKDKVTTARQTITEVFIKQDGMWRTLIHSVHRIPTQ
jgi:hypothetical protein